jgi:hypothetical protein
VAELNTQSRRLFKLLNFAATILPGDVLGDFRADLALVAVAAEQVGRLVAAVGLQRPERCYRFGPCFQKPQHDVKAMSRFFDQYAAAQRLLSPWRRS